MEKGVLKGSQILRSNAVDKGKAWVKPNNLTVLRVNVVRNKSIMEYSFHVWTPGLRVHVGQIRVKD